MLQVAISSEISGLLNFFICELLIMSYTMHVTSYIAGALNFLQLDKGRSLRLKVFNSPFGIGGGLVMNTSRARYILIFLRFAILVAITASNFGLEGRTTVVQSSGIRTVRKPGRIEKLNITTLFNASERNMRCAHIVADEQIAYGSVVDDQCFPELTSEVYIKSIALTYTNMKASAVGCSLTRAERRLFTVFRCRGVDVNCWGLFNETSPPPERGRCESIIYEKDHVWLCPALSARPGVVDEPVSCLKVEARREDIQLWTKIFRFSTDELERAIFGAAYGAFERKEVTVPVGERNVTVVTLFWLVPLVVEIIIVWIVTIWAIYLLRRGAKNVGNDENGLTRLLNNKIDVEKTMLNDYLDDVEVPSSIALRSLPVYEDS